jgi:hypothetical protein
MSRKRTKVVVEGQCNDLRTLLHYLPQSLPEPSVSRYNFGPVTADEIEDYGSESCALTHRLEQEFGHLNPESRYHFQLLERGAGPMAGGRLGCSNSID